MPAALAAGDQDLLAPAATGSGAVGGAFPLTLFALVHISRDYLAGGLVRDVPHRRESAQLPRKRPIRSRRRPRPAAKLETTPGTNAFCHANLHSHIKPRSAWQSAHDRDASSASRTAATRAICHWVTAAPCDQSASASVVWLIAAKGYARPCQPASGPFGSGFVLRNDARGDAPAVADRDALVLRPRPDITAVLTA